MQLINLTVAELVAGAGGDPWEVNRTLQAGQPGQMSNLANAVHSAGRSTALPATDPAARIAVHRVAMTAPEKWHRNVPAAAAGTRRDTR